MPKNSKTHTKLVVVVVDRKEGTTDVKNHKVLKNSKQHKDLLKKYWNAETTSESVCSSRIEKHRIIHTTVVV